MWSYNNIDELYHYGVKGMKWRKRKKKYGGVSSYTAEKLRARDAHRNERKAQYYQKDIGDFLETTNKNKGKTVKNNFNTVRRDDFSNMFPISTDYYYGKKQRAKNKAAADKENKKIKNRVKKALKKIGKKKLGTEKTTTTYQNVTGSFVQKPAPYRKRNAISKKPHSGSIQTRR